MVVGGIAAAFVLATLSMLSRWIARDARVQELRDEVIRLRTEYAKRTAEAEIIEAEEERLATMVPEPEAARKEAA